MTGRDHCQRQVAFLLIRGHIVTCILWPTLTAMYLARDPARYLLKCSNLLYFFVAIISGDGGSNAMG